MTSMIREAVTLVFSLVILISVGGMGVKYIHDEVREIVVKRVKKGISPSESFAQKLTGEKLPF
jgi:hypothetical protein